VLCADHELNASTLSARVAASCDAPLHSCVLSALGTFSGDLHGARSRQIEDVVRGSMHYASVSSWFKQYSRDYPVPPGFGMQLYPDGDPRGKSLVATAVQTNSRSAPLKQLMRIIEYVEEQTGQKPNIDCGLAALSFALELPPGSATALFAISRTVDWSACFNLIRLPTWNFSSRIT
jgi:citrate synthase